MDGQDDDWSLEPSKDLEQSNVEGAPLRAKKTDKTSSDKDSDSDEEDKIDSDASDSDDDDESKEDESSGEDEEWNSTQKNQGSREKSAPPARRKQSVSLVFSAPTKRGSFIVRRDAPPSNSASNHGGGGSAIRDALAKRFDQQPPAEAAARRTGPNDSSNDTRYHSDTESDSDYSSSASSTDESGDEPSTMGKEANRRGKSLHKLSTETDDQRREARKQRRQEKDKERERQTQRRVQELQGRVRALIDRQTREESGEALIEVNDATPAVQSLANEYDESLAGEAGEDQEEEDPQDFVFAPDDHLRLPRRVLERIMIYFRPSELAVLGLVQKAWQRAADSNAVWRTFFRGTQAQNYSLPSWKRFYKMCWRRNKIAEEILSTEQTYVQSLRAVVEVFMNPLRDPTNNQIITHADLKGIFSEIEVILGYNAKLFTDLVDRMKQWHFDICLGDIFAKMSMFLKVYTQYVNHFNKAITTVARLKRTSEDFRAFLMYSQNRKQCKGLDLNAFLIMPVQRIPRYVMLLTDLVKHTHPSHPDYTALANARTKMQELAVFINIQKKEAENIYEVISIQDKLIGKFENIVVPGRMYVSEGILAEVQLAPNSKGKIQKMSNTMRKKNLASPSSERGTTQISAYKKTDHYAFLFNDMIVLAKKSGLTSLINFNFMAKKAKKKLMKNEDHQQKDVDSYEFEMQIILSGDCTVANAPEAIIGTEVFAHCFQLFTDDRAWLFAVPSDREKTEWMSVLDKALLDLAAAKAVATRISGTVGSTPSPSSSSSTFPLAAEAASEPSAIDTPSPPSSSLLTTPAVSSSLRTSEAPSETLLLATTSTETPPALAESERPTAQEDPKSNSTGVEPHSAPADVTRDLTIKDLLVSGSRHEAEVQPTGVVAAESIDTTEEAHSEGVKSRSVGSSKTPDVGRKSAPNATKGATQRRHSFSMNTLFRKKAKPQTSEPQQGSSLALTNGSSSKEEDKEGKTEEAQQKGTRKYLRKRANSANSKKKAALTTAIGGSSTTATTATDSGDGQRGPRVGSSTQEGENDREEEQRQPAREEGGWDEATFRELRQKRAERTSTGTWFRKGLDANAVPILADGIGSSRLRATMLKTPLGSRGMSPSSSVDASNASVAAQPAEGVSSDDQGDHSDGLVSEAALQSAPQQPQPQPEQQLED